MSGGTCTMVKTNAHVHDFACNLGAGHSEPHRDPITGTRWRHPAQPYGMRKLHNKNLGHAKVKPKSWWSDKPVVGYKSGAVEPDTIRKMKGAAA